MPRTCPGCKRPVNNDKLRKCYYCPTELPEVLEVPKTFKAPKAPKAPMLCVKIPVQCLWLIGKTREALMLMNPDYKPSTQEPHITMFCAEMSDDMARFIRRHLEEILAVCRSYGDLKCNLDYFKHIVTSEEVNMIAACGDQEDKQQNNQVLQALRNDLWKKIFELTGEPEISLGLKGQKPTITYQTPKGWLKVFEHDAWNCDFMLHITLLRTKRPNIPNLSYEQWFNIQLPQNNWVAEIT